MAETDKLFIWKNNFAIKKDYLFLRMSSLRFFFVDLFANVLKYLINSSSSSVK